MIGLVLASLILGGSGVSAMVADAPAMASIDPSLPTDGENGRVEGVAQRALPPDVTITSVYVISGYAMIGWSRNGKPAGQTVLSHSTGVWRVLSSGAGVFDAPTLVSLGVGGRDANTLVEGAEPVTPDRGYAPLLGTWQCASAAGPAREQFAMDQSGHWLTFHNPNGGPGTFEDNYFYWESATRHWSTASIGAQGVSFSGRSDGWRHGALLFDGIQTSPKSTGDVRETLNVADDGSLTDSWEARSGHGWVVFNTAHCVKLS